MRAVAAVSADRHWVRVLGAFLPAGYRERQQGEWEADLRTLSDDRRARRAYLTGVIRTLPALRAAARGHQSAVLEPPGLPSAVTAWRVITFVLANTVIGWLVGMLVPFLYLRSRYGYTGGLMMSDWLSSPGWLVALVNILALGRLLAAYGPILIVYLAVVVLIVACTERRRDGWYRFGGVVVAILIVVMAPMLNVIPALNGGGYLMILALSGVPLLTRRAGLSVPRRVILGVFIVAGLAVAIMSGTELGHDMIVWVRD